MELLLAGLGTNGSGHPERRWSDDARRIYANAVAWATDVAQAGVTGVVTGGGAPVAQATVRVVETGQVAVTAADGSYALGMAGGEYTLEVSAHGFAPATVVVSVPATGTVVRDVDLAPLPRVAVTGVVRSRDGAPVAGAVLAGAGPEPFTVTTGTDGGFTVPGLLEGDYQVAVTHDRFLDRVVSVTVTADQPALPEITLRPNTVGVLGDVFGSMTGLLLDAGMAVQELAWDPELDVSGLEVVVVNGGRPDGQTFGSVLAALDAAGVSVVFTGTWAVDRGGIRLLERHTGRVRVAAQGFGEGPVQLTGHDPGHPLFAGLAGDPAELVVDGGYWSTIAGYDGRPLAGLQVPQSDGEAATGGSVAWSWRTPHSVELLLSASAITGAQGPGLGWTPAAERLLVNAVDWVRDRQLAPPVTPGVQVEPPATVEETISVAGSGSWPAQVTVLVDGVPAVTVPVGTDDRWQARVPVPVGASELTAVASNAAGDSPVSAPVPVARWQPQWQVVGGGPARAVMLSLVGAPRRPEPADAAQLLVLDADGEPVAKVPMRWVAGSYLGVLRGLPAGELRLAAELSIDGHTLTVPGPPL